MSRGRGSGDDEAYLLRSAQILKRFQFQPAPLRAERLVEVAPPVKDRRLIL
jgi:hypothetical protein